MGQGFSLATPSAGSAGIDIVQLQDIQYERSIGNARFMKSIRGRHEHGVVLVKVLLKPYAEANLDEYKKKLLEERKLLVDVPNALPFQRIIETETSGYLVRQFQYSSLYDRLSTRPFLEDIEKKWLAFQLLCALRDCHARDVYHGDIKAQNVLVTSWNWLYLTDFSSAYKPILLPDDNPGDFSYFFDTSGRRTCYIAPERFYASGQAPQPEAKMTWAMDIFSAGCVIAQMFLESEMFSLAQLYKYKRGEYDPVITHLSVISDKDVRDMIAHMIQLDPEKRYSADQYLDFGKGKIFPTYFYNFLHQYMDLITDPSSGNNPLSGSQRNMGESDDRIDRVFYDFDKISYFLGYQSGNNNNSISNSNSKKKKQKKKKTKRGISCAPPSVGRLALGHFPVRLSIPNHEHVVSADLEPPEDDGTLIFLTLIVSSLRTTGRASSRVRACDVLLAFAERLTDEAKLDRVLPYLMTLLRREETDAVIVAAIRTITQLLQLVRMPTPINSHVMVEYVLPRLEIALGSRSRMASSLVRATYASCIGSLASTAQRFLEIASSLRADGSVPVADPEIEAGANANANADAADTDAHADADADAKFESVFDNAGRELFEMLESHVKQLVEDPDVYVRRAFLASVPELCMFFQEHANDVLLTHLNTYLNDRDWMLKCAFFDTIVGIATFLGSTSLEEFMLPLMLQALADGEETVVQAVLHSLAHLAGLGLLSRPRIWELADLVGRFTMHPNIWIREAATRFISQASKFLDAADVRCILVPLITPYLKIKTVAELDELSLLESLKKPLTRAVFDQAIVWAEQSTDRGVFWKPLDKMRPVALGKGGGRGGGGGSPSTPRPSSSSSSSKDVKSKVAAMVRNDEDEQWLSKLRNLGLKTEDDTKLLGLRDFIWRLSKARAREPAATRERETAARDAGRHPSGMISLKELGVTPQTVFFNDAPLRDASMTPDLESPAGPYTIADALLDASMTIDDTVSKRRKAALVGGQVHRVQAAARRRLLSSPASVGSTRTSSQHSQHSRRELSSESKKGGDDGLHSTTTTTTTTTTTRRGMMRHQPSALSLLDRKDGIINNSSSSSSNNHTNHNHNNKSMAETGTSEANAFGEVEGPFPLPQSMAASPAPTTRDNESSCLSAAAAAATAPRQARHTYEGTDPHIQRMLDQMYIDNFPRDVLEFGPMVPSISRSRDRAVAVDGGGGGRNGHAASGGNDDDNDYYWRPEGHLVATFAEHKGPINRIVASPDHIFFITGGHDGCVRVWDTARLERNITHRSRQTHRHAEGAHVVALCFVENTHCFVSCASDGSVHVVKVDTVSASSGVIRYGKLRVVRDHRLPAGEFAVWCEHFRQDSHSVLLLATNRSRILGLELRTMTLLYVLENPIHHGAPTCFCVDRKRNWLCVGTSHGVVDLWDLRFKMRLRGWGVPGKGAVYRLCIHPVKGRGKWICVAGGTGHGEVTVWDLEKTTCREVYRTSNGGGAGSGGGGGGGGGDNHNGASKYVAWEVDEDKPQGMLGRFATNLESNQASNADRGVRAMLVGSGAGSAHDVRHAFLLTGGSDKKLRFWDLTRVDKSRVYSGLPWDEPPPTYTAAQTTSALTITTEKTPRYTSSGGDPTTGAAQEGNKGTKTGARPPRSTVISLQQQQLLQSHLDGVLDMVLLEYPYGMSVSVDRSGVVFVFQ
ncbi:hypothetical protein E4U43_007835 [Claviceps pusilla]|uniref:non-specific serine/threonine protein kinase n=1 Tax=Claviceps pusilla TaxID=123648 RepID=A0A9P7NC65_9HYPO|nr:hypothetical protein E4U43_007835 [Claviceps pusilla]